MVKAIVVPASWSISWSDNAPHIRRSPRLSSHDPPAAGWACRDCLALTNAAFALCLLRFSFSSSCNPAAHSVDLLLLRSGQWPLISRAIAHILGGSAPRFFAAGAAVLMLQRGLDRARLTGACCHRGDSAQRSRFGRCASRSPMALRSLCGLNFIRAQLSMLLCSPNGNRDPGARLPLRPAVGQRGLFVVMGCGLLHPVCWFVVNCLSHWQPSSWCAMAQHVWRLTDAADLCTRHLGPVLAASSAFAIFHFALWITSAPWPYFHLACWGCSRAPGNYVARVADPRLLCRRRFLYVGRMARIWRLRIPLHLQRLPHVHPCSIPESERCKTY